MNKDLNILAVNLDGTLVKSDMLLETFWSAFSNDLFKLKINKNEVGSSTMPHKVNHIDFENSEGNLQLANSLLVFLADKLQKSRLQRDLSDSTVLRNVGTAISYSFLGIKSSAKVLS